MMRIVRLYTAPDGYSRFEDGVIEMALSDFSPPDPPLAVSELVGSGEVGGVRFLQIPSGWSSEQGPTPRRMHFILLAGVLDIESSDGEQRRFGPGSVLLLEDTTGIGHRSRVVGMSPVQAVIVELEKPA